MFTATGYTLHASSVLDRLRIISGQPHPGCQEEAGLERFLKRKVSGIVVCALLTGQKKIRE